MRHSRQEAEGKTWCDQCQRNVRPAEGAACKMPFCKGPKPVPIGFPPEAKPEPPKVEVPPALARRVERQRAPEPTQQPEPPTEAAEPMPERQPGPVAARMLAEAKRGHLTRKQREMLNLLANRADRRGLVRASNRELGAAFGISGGSAASLIKALEREGEITVMEQSNGLIKKSYRVHRIAPTAISEQCGNCRYGHKEPDMARMVCRRHPPTAAGHPRVPEDNWCGEWKAE